MTSQWKLLPVSLTTKPKPLTFNLDMTYDLDFQFQASYGHKPYIDYNWSSKAIPFNR